MRWKYLRVAALAAFLAAPAAVSAQTPDSANADHHGYGALRERAMSGPAGWLLAHRDDLKLSDDQVKKLESQRTKFSQQNKPLMEKLQANRQAARKDAAALLTPEQRDQLKQHAQMWRERRDSTGRGGRRQRAEGAASDS
jgi:Spy/CpxP family protein refolding chaperone